MERFLDFLFLFWRVLGNPLGAVQPQVVDRLNKQTNTKKKRSKPMERGSPSDGPRDAFGDHFKGFGAPLEVILGSWGGLGRPFWGSGGTPGRVRRAVVAKEPPPLLRPPLFKRFWRPK